MECIELGKCIAAGKKMRSRHRRRNGNPLPHPIAGIHRPACSAHANENAKNERNVEADRISYGMRGAGAGGARGTSGGNGPCGIPHSRAVSCMSGNQICRRVS